MSDGAGNISNQLSPPSGKIDHILSAPQVIRANIQRFIDESSDHYGDTKTPTIPEATSTHNCVLSKSFRPSVLIAVEYTSTSGVGSLGGVIEFTPKHNSDYQNDAYVKFTLPEVSCTSAPLPDIVVRSVHRLPSAIAAGSVPNPLNFATGSVVPAISVQTASVVKNGFTYSVDALGALVPNDPITWNGRTWYLRLSAEAATNGVGSISYTYTDAYGNFVAGPDGKASPPTADGLGGGLAATPRVQVANNVVAADFIGVKLCSNVAYSVDENRIDEYTANIAMMRRDSFISEGAQRNFDRLVGQEVPFTSPVEVHAIGGNTTNGFGSGKLCQDSYREYRKFATGLQTPKPVQPSQVVHIPLMFYHNLCRANAMPTCIHPDASLSYTIQTPTLQELYYPCAGAVFIEERVTLYSAVASGTIVAPRHELMRRIPFLVPGSVVQTTVRDVNLSPQLFLCNLYLDDVLHLCLLSRVFFRMIRLFVDQSLNVSLDSSGAQEVELTGKFPVEYVMLTERSLSSFDGMSVDNAQDWHENGFVYRDDQSKFIHRTVRLRSGLVNDYVTYHDQLSCEHVKTVSPIISSMSVSVYDTSYQSMVDGSFYTDYLQYTLNNGIWHSNDKQCPRKIINFSHRPGDDVVMGHCSVSKQRSIKLQMNINTPRVEPSRDGIQGGDVVVRSVGYSKARIIATLSQINFLLGSDGAMSRRYQ
jgi:hypothetical protein